MTKGNQEKIRPLLPYGYRTYTGVIPHDVEIDRYNYIQGRINQSIKEGYPVRESLLNESHYYFVMMARDYEKENKGKTNDK